MEHLAAISRVVQRHLKVVLRYLEATLGYLGVIWGASGSQFGGICRYREVFRGHLEASWGNPKAFREFLKAFKGI